MSFFNGAKAKRWRITPFWTLTLFFPFFSWLFVVVVRVFGDKIDGLFTAVF